MAERVSIVLVCQNCGARNYKTTKSMSANLGQRLEKRKFCPSCKTHTSHIESK